jgi:hypothetical protein
MFGECRPSQNLTYILGPYENLPWVGPCAVRKPSLDLCLVEGDPAVDAFIKACLYEQEHPEAAEHTDGRPWTTPPAHAQQLSFGDQPSRVVSVMAPKIPPNHCEWNGTDLPPVSP